MQPHRTKYKRTFVYFISTKAAPGELPNPFRPIKIGITDNLTKRMAQLQTGSSHELVLIGTLKFRNRQQALRKEAQLHSRFAHLRLTGEWFSAGPELLLYLAELGIVGTIANLLK